MAAPDIEDGIATSMAAAGVARKPSDSAFSSPCRRWLRPLHGVCPQQKMTGAAVAQGGCTGLAYSARLVDQS